MARRYSEVDGDDVLVGSVVADRYHVAGVLGHGSTGTVFGVEHIQLGRRAVMKVLRPRSAHSDLVHRVFHGDARAAWSISHACLAEVFDVGTLPDGSPYFVTEYLEGETLAKRMTRDRLSLAAAVDVMMQLLSAITAVHERALLVRDLRPQNVFLSHRRGCRPVAKLLDLGLARLMPLEAVAEQWEADAVSAATTHPHPFYLSPERTRSEHGIEPASDLFVAGVVFYEMLTGVRPFSAPTYHGLLLKIAQADPTPVSELRDHSLAHLDAFVERALSGNPRSRFPSAKEMQDELRRIFESAKRGGGHARESSQSTSIAAQGSGKRPAPTAPPPSGPTGTGSGPRPAPGAVLSSQMSAPGSLPPLASALEPGSGRDQTLSTEAPTATSTERPQLADLYADETDTDRRFYDLPPQRDPASSQRGFASPMARPLPAVSPPSGVKNNPRMGSDPSLTQQPTMPAFRPTPIEAFKPVPIDDDFEEEPTEARNAVYEPELRAIRDANKTPLPPVPEEETQQLQMTPELRAKIEAQYAARPPPPRPPMNSEMDSIPPPTKRLDNK